MSEPIQNAVSSPGLILQAGAARYRVIGSPGSEIASRPHTATVPDAPHWLLGIGLHKNEAIPIVHLQALLADQKLDAPAAAKILVMRGAGPAVAWLVDDVNPDDGRDEAADLDLPSVGRLLMSHAFLSKKP